MLGGYLYFEHFCLGIISLQSGYPKGKCKFCLLELSLVWKVSSLSSAIKILKACFVNLRIVRKWINCYMLSERYFNNRFIL